MKEDTLSSTPMAQGNSLYVIAGDIGEGQACGLDERMLSREDGCDIACKSKVSVGLGGGEKKRLGQLVQLQLVET